LEDITETIDTVHIQNHLKVGSVAVEKTERIGVETQRGNTTSTTSVTGKKKGKMPSRITSIVSNPKKARNPERTETMGVPISDSHFRFMTLALRLRDVFKPPKKVLNETTIKAGDTVLDYGCGPGSYSLAAARLVGDKGQVYSLDIHPMAIQSVRRRAKRKGLKNIEPVFSDGDTGFPDKSVDVILLYDVFHEFAEPEKILVEMHRILKDEGTISLHDHHLKDKEILSSMTNGNHFQLLKKDKRTHTFKKA
jgi:SAM-dependent methyltransferase